MEHPVLAQPDSASAPVARRSVAAPVLVWAVISMLPLLLSATRTPLWARVSPPLEQFALPMMLMTQLGVVAMLFPWLLSDPRAVGVVMLGSGLLLQLAGMLGGGLWSEIARAMVWVWMWQGSLALVVASLRTPRAQQVAAAIATTAAVGGMLLIYLRGEFSGDVKVGNSGPLWTCFGVVLLGAVANSFLRSRQAINR